MKLVELIDRIDQTPGLAYIDETFELSFHDLADLIRGWAIVLQSRPEQTWGLHLSDTRCFSYMLLALLTAGKHVRLLPHVQPGLLQELQSDLDAYIIDEPVDGLAIPCLPHGRLPIEKPVPAPKETAIQPLAFYTSGSTGRGKMFIKDLDQLLTEVKVQEELWGGPEVSCGVCATVSHQHIYGFLFKFLRPLVSGCRVWAPTCFYPAEIEEAVVRLGRCDLISVPAHLKRLPHLLDWALLKGRCRNIYSSGGPLPTDAAREVKERFGKAPIEVFGSTETGGVAWRRQDGGEEPVPWTPFPGLSVACDPATGCLQLASPFIHPSECASDVYTMQDRIERFSDGRFLLKGRVDRIVKIEQKRVSLEHMEQRLISLAEVDDAAVVLLNDGAHAGRSRLGAAIVLSSVGRSRFEELKTAPQQSDFFRRQLQTWFEPAVLPRSWVYVDRLPENAQGKRPQAALQALFAARKTPQRDAVLPVVLSENCKASEVTLDCRVPDNLLYFDGHFDILPVVAGVVQVNWAMRFAETYFGITPDARRLEAVKFHHLLLPKDHFTLVIKHAVDTQKIQFALFQDDKKYSSGRVVLCRP